MFYGATPGAPLVLAVGCMFVGFSGLLAAYILAFRVASIDPAEALRGNGECKFPLPKWQ